MRFDELELMLMAMFEQPTLKDTIQVLLEVQPLVAEDAEMAALVQQTIPKMQRLTEPQFKGLELEWHRPEDDRECSFFRDCCCLRCTSRSVPRMLSTLAHTVWSSLW